MTQIKKAVIEIENQDRRRDVRAPVVEYWRISVADSSFPDEICTVHNVSRHGLYFAAVSKHYVVGMKLRLIRNFESEGCTDNEKMGEVVRVGLLPGNKLGV